MYEPFFGLTREAFSVAPDPHFMYMSPKHREAIGHLIYGLRRGAGFVLLTGDIGAGKTTVWRSFLERLPTNFDVAYVVNPKLQVNALLTRVCEDLRIDLSSGSVDLIDAIHGHLLLAFAGGRRTLIVVDEAQALSSDVLEQLRLLTNLDSTGGKLQVLLIGQPELRTILQQPALEPLAQRVVARFHLTALSEDETARYIAHRMTVAGLVGEVPFDAQALRLIHELCGGVPRRINVLCDRALMTAQLAASLRVGTHIVEQAADEVFGRSAPAAAVLPPPVHEPVRPPWRAIAATAVGAVAVGALLAPDAVTRVVAVFSAGASPRAVHPATSSAGSSTPAAAAAVAAASAPAAAAPAVASPAPEPVPVPEPVPEPESVPSPSTTSVAATATPATPTQMVPPPVATPPSPAPSAAAARVADANTVVPPAELPRASALPQRQYSTLPAVFGTATVDESSAWRALALLWGVTLDAGDPCAAAPKQGLRCYVARGGLGSIRQLQRPGILKLSDEHGGMAYALLVALSEDGGTFRSNGVEQTVPLSALSRWRGEFATLWRPPPGYREADPAYATGALAPWLGERLAMIDEESTLPVGADALTSRVFAFQLAQGLNPDGLPGPLTLMQLNRLSGVDEPTLQLKR